MAIVNITKPFDYKTLEFTVKQLKLRYPFVETGSIGKSVLGRDLLYIKLGDGKNKVFYNGAHHGLEWITALMLAYFAEDLSEGYVNNLRICGYNIRELFSKVSIYIVPMVNPDGVDLVINGLSKDNPYYEDLKKQNSGCDDFSKIWQANIRGVDLNHNYDAGWDLSKAAEKENGIHGPGPTRYSGEHPESEPESLAVANFTRNNLFDLVIAFHSQGKEIYWNYQNLEPISAKRIGRVFEEVSPYKLAEVDGMASFAGYKDWFIKEFNRPGYTVEVGCGKNPLPIEDFCGIYQDTLELMIVAGLL